MLVIDARFEVEGYGSVRHNSCTSLVAWLESMTHHLLS